MSDSVKDGPELQRLAALPPIEYDRERETVAKRLGIRVSTLDAAVERVRNTDAPATGRGRPLELPEPDPWPAPVVGTELLDALFTVVRRHVAMDEAMAAAIALWVLAVYAFEQFFIFPRLAITSPEKRCGKTTLLDLLGRLVPRPVLVANVTAAAVFRLIETAWRILLIDEADSFLRKTEDLRNVLNSGHRLDGAVNRCAGRGGEPRQFSTSSPAVIATIGRLPGTLEDRAIVIRLRRCRSHEASASLRIGSVTDHVEITRKAARWTRDAADSLAGADPTMPMGLFDRFADNWRPLLAVADEIGGDWPTRARAAAVALSATGDGDASAGVLLLSDLRELFDAEPSGALFSEEIVQRLCFLEDRPWSEFIGGKPITKPQVAKLLKPFDVSPGSVRRGVKTAKGYRREDLADAFARYLPAGPVAPLHTETILAPPPAARASGVTQCDVVQSASAVKSLGCDGVTAKTAVAAQEHDDPLEIPAFLRRVP